MLTENGPCHYVPSVANALLEAADAGAHLPRPQGLAIGNAWVNPKAQYASKPLMAFTGGFQEGGSVHGVVNKTALPSDVSNHVTSIGSPWAVSKPLRLALFQSTSPLAGFAGEKCAWSARRASSVETVQFRDRCRFCSQWRLASEYDWPGDKDAGAWGASFGLLRGSKLSVQLLSLSLLCLTQLRASAWVCTTEDTDLMVDWLGTKAWTKELSWSGAREWAQVTEQPFVAGRKTHGRFRSFGGLTFLQLFNAGHLVPMDQPDAALAMVMEFLSKNSPWRDIPERKPAFVYASVLHSAWPMLLFTAICLSMVVLVIVMLHSWRKSANPTSESYVLLA
eukprot:Skav225260  [mRNA]  locus=scaffold4099:53601:56072:+ [translate_table: standard]